MARTNDLNKYANLTPEERMKRVVEILSEIVLIFIREQNQKSEEDGKKDIDTGR
jgi:hypothetical protein